MMLTQSLRDPFARIFADFDPIEVKAAPVSAAHRPRRSTADRVRAALMALTDGAGTVLSHDEKPWASITLLPRRGPLGMKISSFSSRSFWSWLSNLS